MEIQYPKSLGEEGMEIAEADLRRGVAQNHFSRTLKPGDTLRVSSSLKYGNWKVYPLLFDVDQFMKDRRWLWHQRTWGTDEANRTFGTWDYQREAIWKFLRLVDEGRRVAQISR